MSRIDQFTLDMGDGAPAIVSYDSKTAKPYVDGQPPPTKPRRTLTLKKQPPPSTTTFVERLRGARGARDQAIDQVTENERRAWHELHDKEMMAFLKARGNKPFIAEDFRRWFSERGHEDPHHPNVWGAMWMAATKHGLIVKTGRYLPPQDVHSHARLTTEWVNPDGVQEL